MFRLTSRKALAITTFVVVAPFVLISIYSFLYIKSSAEANFKETMSRFTKNTAHASIEVPVRKINLLFNSLSSLMDKEDITESISPRHAETNALLPSLINANDIFSNIILSDDHDNYRIYPNREYKDYKPSQRPWFPADGMKDTIYFSEPYISANKNALPNNEVNTITVSMNLFDRQLDFIGNIALDLNLNALSNTLKGQVIPYDGRFMVAAMDGSIIMYSNTREIFTQKIPTSWLSEVKDSNGWFLDNKHKEIVFYRAYQNPDWIAFTAVSDDHYDKLLNDSYIVLIYIMLGCLFCYSIIAIIARIYFKKWIDILYLNINDNGANEIPRNLEGICKGIAKKNETLKEAVQAATTDPLTQIGSRRKFEQDILNLFNDKKPFHLAMIDLDNFKKINDTWGHQTGDCVLKSVSKIGAERFGGIHFIYRFGGEELVAIICDLSFAECYELIDSWRYTVTQRKWREQSLQVSFSCGIVSSSEYETIDEMVAIADKHLYQAKEAGKNCIYPPLS